MGSCAPGAAAGTAGARGISSAISPAAAAPVAVARARDSAAAPARGEAGDGARARQQPERPPERPVGTPAPPRPGPAGTRSRAAHRPAIRPRAARPPRPRPLESAELIEALAHPGGVGRRRDVGWSSVRHPGKLREFVQRRLARRRSSHSGPKIRGWPAGGVTLFRVRGIRIAVDFSWFVVLFLIIFWLSGFYRDVLERRATATPPPTCSPWPARPSSSARSCCTSWGTPSSRSDNGIGVSAITLWMFGGVARLDQGLGHARDRVQDRRRRTAGHGGDRGVCAVAGLALAGGDEFRHAALTQQDTQTYRASRRWWSGSAASTCSS